VRTSVVMTTGPLVLTHPDNRSGLSEWSCHERQTVRTSAAMTTGPLVLTHPDNRSGLSGPPRVDLDAAEYEGSLNRYVKTHPTTMLVGERPVAM
jgi:hypothetical protein